MAVRPATKNASGPSRKWLITASLVVLFIAALFLRAYWNVDAAHPGEGEFVLSGGSDPYYHKRAVDAILADGDNDGRPDFKTLIDDPLLNYPYGSVNPNPPLYQWSVAVTGYLMEPFFDPQTAPDGTVLSSLEVSTWYAMLWSPAIFGALTLIPIFFIGRALFDWRAGLVAATLWTVSTSAIDSTGLGLADHDAAIMFFASLSFLFYIKTVERFRGDGNWVRNWGDGAAVTSGLGALYRERAGGYMYALLTGVSIGAVALIWKGFPYVVGIIFAYAVLQMVIDHWRNRDSTGLFTATGLALLVGTLLAYPAYAALNVTNFITPVFFIIAAFVAIGAVLVPTRDLPSILVMPAVAIVGILAAIASFFVFPNVAQKLLHSIVYFKQSTLYATIAEAHPADFSTITFGIGPLPFFAAVAGWFVLLFTIKNHPRRALLFALVWGAVALFMANSAVRFLFNAIPVFVVFAGYMLVWLVDWLNFGTIKKGLVGTGGWAGFRKGLRPMHVVGVLILVFALVVPNVLLAADAALPRSEEVRISREYDSGSFFSDLMLKRFGAYGQNFISPEWHSSLTWLNDYDANTTNTAERGAFLSWWDYGHWAIAIGRHPAVADNFQNGYEFAAEFLLAQNETQSIQLMTARLMPVLSTASDANTRWTEIRDAASPMLVAAGVAQADVDATVAQLIGCPSGVAACAAAPAFQYAPALDKAKAVAFLSSVESATGKKIRFFVTDIRMMPLDDPETAYVSTVPGQSRWEEQSSIFYAPVTLANRHADSFVPVKINTGSAWVTQDEYNELARNPVRTIQASAERIEYTPAFFNTMYYRAFVGTPARAFQQGPMLGDSVYEALVCALPGYNLAHYRVVNVNPEIKILEYYPGAIVTGTVNEDGAPANGVTVTVYDDAGRILSPSGRLEGCPGNSVDGNVPHDSAVTDASGAYTLRAPFNMPGGVVTLVATRDGQEVGRSTLEITREEAQSQASFDGAITLLKGTVNANFYEDVNNDGVYDAANDTMLVGANVVIGGVNATTDANGNATFVNVPGGAQTVSIVSDQYEIGPRHRTVSVPGGGSVNATIAVVTKAATVTGNMSDGVNALPSVQLSFVPVQEDGNYATIVSATTDENGAYTVTLRPGHYTIEASGYTIADNDFIVAAGAVVERNIEAEPVSNV